MQTSGAYMRDGSHQNIVAGVGTRCRYRVTVATVAAPGGAGGTLDSTSDRARDADRQKREMRHGLRAAIFAARRACTGLACRGRGQHRERRTCLIKRCLACDTPSAVQKQHSRIGRDQVYVIHSLSPSETMPTARSASVAEEPHKENKQEAE